jgi:hypothetical protein
LLDFIVFFLEIKRSNALFTFRSRYFIVALALFIIEVAIAMFVEGGVVRGWLGDFLVVIMLYCFICAFLNMPVIGTAILVLLFAFGIEASQYFELIQILGLQDFKLAKGVLGSSFAGSDLIAYTLGMLMVLLIERISLKPRNTLKP